MEWSIPGFFKSLLVCWPDHGYTDVQYIPRNMHTVFALLCFVVVIHWLIFPYPSGLLLWHCGNLTIAPVPAKQPWWIWINTSCEFIMNSCITTTKQSTTKPCAYFLGYTVQQMFILSCIWIAGYNNRRSYVLDKPQPEQGSMPHSWISSKLCKVINYISLFVCTTLQALFPTYV